MLRPILAATTALFISTSAFAAGEVKHELRTAIPSAGILRVVLEVPVSQLRVINSTDGSIEISGAAKREYGNEKEMKRAQKIVDATEMKVELRGSRATISPYVSRVIGGRRGTTRGTEFELTLRVPSHLNVEVHQKVGEIEIDGRFADVEVGLRVGEVRVKIPKDAIREVSAKATIGEVRTNFGDRIVTREGLFAGRTVYMNDAGRSLLKVDVSVGEIDIELR